MTEVAAPLRRRWGVGADPAPQACEPFSYAGSFDGLAQKSEVSTDGLWGTSGWFAGGSPDTAATTQRESATLLATAPSEPAVAPGGAVSQNRLTTAATLRQPFAPTSAQRTLAESVRVPDAHEMSHTAAVFDVTAGRAGRSSFTGRSHKLADGRPGHAGWTYRCVGECLAWLRLWRLISPTSFPRPLTLAAPVLSTQARDKGVGVRHRPRAAPPASRCCVAAGA